MRTAGTAAEIRSAGGTFERSITLRSPRAGWVYVETEVSNMISASLSVSWGGWSRMYGGFTRDIPLAHLAEPRVWVPILNRGNSMAVHSAVIRLQDKNGRNDVLSLVGTECQFGSAWWSADKDLVFKTDGGEWLPRVDL